MTTTIAKPVFERLNIRWNEGLGISPDLQVFCSDSPDPWDFDMYSSVPHKLVESVRDHDIYLATFDEWAHFVAVVNNSKSFNKGACTGELLLEDGSKLRVTDGWSSRASYLNSLLPEKDHIVDVIVYGGKYKGMGRVSLALRVDFIKELLPHHTYLVRSDRIEPSYYPSIKPDAVVKPSGQVCV